ERAVEDVLREQIAEQDRPGREQQKQPDVMPRYAWHLAPPSSRSLREVRRDYRYPRHVVKARGSVRNAGVRPSSFRLPASPFDRLISVLDVPLVRGCATYIR